MKIGYLIMRLCFSRKRIYLVEIQIIIFYVNFPLVNSTDIYVYLKLTNG